MDKGNPTQEELQTVNWVGVYMEEWKQTPPRLDRQLTILRLKRIWW